MAQIRAVIFDLYGVMGLNAWQRFKLHHFGDQPSAWQKLQDLGRQVDAGRATNRTFVHAIAKAAGVSDREVRRQFEDTRPNLELLSWVEQTLQGKVKIGLLSNASRDVLHTIFDSTQRALFDTAITSYHVGMTKPDPRIYQLICDRLGVEPTECIMVDDQARHLEAAGHLGMNTVLYTSLEQATDEIRGLLR